MASDTAIAQRVVGLTAALAETVIAAIAAPAAMPSIARASASQWVDGSGISRMLSLMRSQSVAKIIS